MDLGVQGQGYLLLGGTAGMGLATAEVLARDGAALVLVGRDDDRAHRVADELATAHGTAVHGVAGDIALPGVADRVVEQAADLLDDLAGVGVFTGTKGHSPLSASDEEWTAAFEDVLLGPTRALRAVVPRLVARGGGTIVTVAAYGIHAPQAERIAYGSLKSAVTVLTKGIAKTYGRDGVRANCVCPGAIETDGMHALRGMIADQRDWPYDEALERMITGEWKMNVAMERPGRPDEVGDLVAFLLSQRAGYLSGALINIDGGTDF